MARPLRSWSPSPRPRRPRPGRHAAQVVEPLEGRQLLAASLVSYDTTSLSSGNDDSTDPDISSTGRFVAFVSTATDLDPLDTNATADIYLRDLQTGITRLVSANSANNGTGSAASSNPSVSDDGRFVVFTSTSNNLVAGDNNNVSDVFVRDMFTNTTRLVSVNIGGTQPGNGSSQQGVISDNGRFVAFSSDASNITANDLTTTRDVFLRDLEDLDTTLVSVSAVTGLGGNGASQRPGISANGQFIAFVTAATDLLLGGPTPGPGNNVYLRDTDFDPADPPNPITDPPPVPTTTLVSTTGVAGTGGGVSGGTGTPVVDDIGRFVAFASNSATLVSGDVNGLTDVFRKDVIIGTVVLASQNTAGVFSNGASEQARISADGRYVAFSSVATNLVAEDTNPGSDVFVRDVDGNQTVLVSANLTGTSGTNSSSAPSMTDDARLVAFQSDATTLVTDPVEDTNVFIATTPLAGNDTQRPTFRVPPLGDINAVGSEVLFFDVIYEDNVFVDTGTLDDNDLIVTGPNGFNERATLFNVISTNNLSATVRYTVPAPGGELSSADNGTFTATVQGGQVADFAGNFLVTGSAGTFTLDLPPSETVLPQPSFFGGSPAVGASTYEFTIVYSERGGIDFATFGNDDIRVTGPNGFTQDATFVSQTPLNATQTSVVYRITAPGGTWDAVDTGNYTVSVIEGGVRDLGENPVQSGPLGTFSFTALGADLVAIPLRNLRLGAISGVDQQRARIRILNQGSFTTTVPVAVTLYTSLDKTLDAGDATIGTFIESRPIEADTFRELKVRFTYPQVAAGNYFVIAQVDSANAVVEQSETNNVAASFNQVGLSAPFVDLVPTLVPFSGNRSRLGTNEALVRIRNAGNVEATGDVVVALTAVSDVTPDPSERPVANLPITVRLKPGQSKVFRLPFTFPLEFDRGSYRLVATIDSTNVIPERDEVNNRVVSLSSFNFA